MIFLAITQQGLAEAIQATSKTGEAVWCGAEAVSDPHYAATVPSNVSRFVYGLTGENVVLLEDALSTIAEHHPGQSIWVEAVKREA
jgi:hypothetical protein